MSSGMLHRVVWYKFIDVSEVLPAYIIMAMSEVGWPGWLIDWRSFVSEFWALWDIYGCVIITVAMVMLLRDFGHMV
jgi:hypothetical protein